MTSTTTATDDPASPWPHRLAVLLVCAMFPLLWVGGLVTTKQAGMAVEDWPSTYGYNLFLYPWQAWLYGPFDLFIEHGHRLLGALVGLLAIVLAVGLWWGDGRRWMRVAGVALLLAVIAQGVLGGQRVIQDERMLAMVHGCFGPACFALAVALAVCSSVGWRDAAARPSASGASLARLAAITTLLAYVQLVLGAQLRHMPVTASPGAFRAALWLHLLMAVVLLVHVAALAARAWLRHRGEPLLRRPATWLAALFALQLGLGTGTWVLKYGWPAWLLDAGGLADKSWAASSIVRSGSWTQATVVTSHVACGSLILAVALVVALRSGRHFRAPRDKTRQASPRSVTLASGVLA